MKKKNDATRNILSQVKQLALDRSKMAFISGPRQVGKTTLAKSLQKSFDESIYLNWDDTQFQRQWAKNPNAFLDKFNLNEQNKNRLVILDEIHKSKFWKRKLKGIYDLYHAEIKILVTGSARLNVYKKGGDSLLGRYFHFRLNPLSLAEVSKSELVSPDDFLKMAIHPSSTSSINQKTSWDLLEQLFEFSGFPEPFFARDKKIFNLWQRGRIEKIVREDLRDLSRIVEIGQVEILTSLLPEKVGSPLSIASLREDLDVSFDTVKRWLSFLQELYFLFVIRPYQKSITRTLKKEGKPYLYDWTQVENPASKFENMIAVHLLKSCQFWEDTGEGDFKLYYLRDKEKREVDFLVVKNRIPWFSVECKYKDSKLDTTYQKFQSALGVPHFQLVYEKNIWRKVNSQTWMMSADYFLLCLV
ncbi:MAG: ATP-binding protein [Bacteriovoracaceae bacterium]|nr:ATP-binding protein [Bacteriovoracaceae bacterium]